MKNDKVMKRVSVIVGVIVLIAAGACAWAYFNDVSSGRYQVADGNYYRRTEEVQKTTVVCAAKDIPEDSLIAPDDLEERQVLASKAPESAISSQSIAAGSYASVNIAQGTIILNGHLKRTSGVTLKPAKSKSGPKKKHR